jgi:hypothetical protein
MSEIKGSSQNTQFDRDFGLQFDAGCKGRDPFYKANAGLSYSAKNCQLNKLGRETIPKLSRIFSQWEPNANRQNHTELGPFLMNQGPHPAQRHRASVAGRIWSIVAVCFGVSNLSIIGFAFRTRRDLYAGQDASISDLIDTAL